MHQIFPLLNIESKNVRVFSDLQNISISSSYPAEAKLTFRFRRKTLAETLWKVLSRKSSLVSIDSSIVLIYLVKISPIPQTARKHKILTDLIQGFLLIQ